MAADKVQINPRIMVTTKALVEQAAKERGCATSDIVETALQAFLTQQAPELEVHVQALAGEIREMKAALEGLLEVLAGAEEREAAPVGPAPRVATYAELYGALEPEDPPDAPPPVPASRLRGWRRWVYREAAL
jgi:hypothetical protein